MCLFKRKSIFQKPTRQQKRKLMRDTIKLERKVRKRAIKTLNDPSIPQWIRNMKKAQLERRGFL